MGKKNTNKLTPSHQQLLNEFEQYRLNNNQLFEPVKASIVYFLEFIGEIPFEKLTANDYANFFYETKQKRNIRMKTYAAYHGNLTSFFTFLLENGYRISFMEERHRTFNDFIATLDSKEVRKERPLSLAEWLSLRKTIELKEEYHLLFFIEIIYQYQLKNNEQMANFNINTYFEDYFEFNTNGKKHKYFVTPYLKSIIEKGGMPQKTLKSGTIGYQFKRLLKTVFSKEKIVIGDIYLTSIQNFFTCPNCLNSYENIPENWALFDYGEPHLQLILCRKHCYEEALNG